MTTLTLYHLDYCPYCHAVRRAAAKLGVPLDLVEVSAQPEARRRLIRERGRGTVPVLEIHDAEGSRLMGESRDIIHWLRTNASSLAA